MIVAQDADHDEHEWCTSPTTQNEMRIGMYCMLCSSITIKIYK